MAKNVFLATIIVFLVVADVSNATFFFQFRKLVAPSPKADPNIAPNPIPVTSNGKQPSSVGSEEKGKGKENQANPASNKPMGKGDQGATPPNVSKEENKTPGEVVKNKAENKPETPPKEEVKEKGDSKPDLPRGAKESCNGVSQKCQDTKSMIACVKSSTDVSKGLFLLIQNEGDSDINVDLMIPPSLDKKKLSAVPKHQTETVNVPLPNGGTNEIRLNSGNGDCILHLGAPVPKGSFFRHLPYSKFLTPIYGAYLLFLIILISGAVWACCWFRKRKSRTHSEIPYQELEMSVPETAAVVETAEGWDQDWDDDWDEEKAVKSPGARNISANGLTSRTPSKEDWEDWDD